MKILTILLLLIASPAHAFFSERETLAGLKGATLEVAVNDGAVKAGLALDAMRRGVALKLRQNRIDVVDPTSTDTPENKRAALLVSIDVQNVNGQLVHAVRVVLKQPALLARNSMDIMAPTWTSSVVNGVGDVAAIRVSIDKLLTALIDDWFAANPMRQR